MSLGTAITKESDSAKEASGNGHTCNGVDSDNSIHVVRTCLSSVARHCNVAGRLAKSAVCFFRVPTMNDDPIKLAYSVLPKGGSHSYPSLGRCAY